MIPVIDKLLQIHEIHPELSYREMIKSVMKITDFLSESPETIVALLNQKYNLYEQEN